MVHALRHKASGTGGRIVQGLLLGGLVAFGLPSGIRAADVSKEEVAPKLEKLEEEIAERKERRAALERQAEEMRREVKALREKLITLAADIQEQETRLTVLEEKIAVLEAQEQEASAELARKMAQMADSMAALQRLARRPPAALIASPAPAAETVKTSLALGAVVPALESQAADLSAEIETVANLRAEIRMERETRQTRLANLSENRQKIDRLMKEKAATERKLTDRAREEAERLEALAEEAKSLRALIEKLEEREKRRARVPDIESGQPFTAARGRLPLPARGKFVQLFGERVSETPLNRGIVVETRDHAQVVAPYDGRIVFAGPFRDYGLLLIIAHGEGYHSLLAGMARIDGTVGQSVLAGEPVGEMGTTEESGSPEGGPHLYVELRHDGEPIDPMPWLAASEGKVSG